MRTSQIPPGPSSDTHRDADLKILVATHKPAEMPKDDLYLPIQVGHSLDEREFGYAVDDEGENISSHNRAYCELTAVYWAWKNLSAEAVGLSHYRRYFAGSDPGPNGKGILSREEARQLMSRHDIVLPRPRRYVIETVRSHYIHAHHPEDLDQVLKALSEISPEYTDAYEAVMKGRSLSLYNMFLMRSEAFTAYASWLFPVLELVRNSIDLKSRTAFQQRALGYLGERLLNVWVYQHSASYSVGYRRTVNVEGEHLLRKAGAFIQRKAGVRDPTQRTS